jgi:hypothetical protein
MRSKHTQLSWLYLYGDPKVISIDITRYCSNKNSAYLPAKCDIKFKLKFRIFSSRISDKKK